MEFGLSLGSNLGDRMDNIRNAVGAIADFKDVEVIAVSSVYETDPVDVTEEYSDLPFLNAVIIVASSLDVGEFANGMLGIEDALGRKRNRGVNSPRVLDIDIIYAGEAVIETDDLMIPHPRWQKRRFVVQPLNDVRSGMRIKGSWGTVEEILLSLPQTPKVLLFKAKILL